MFNSYENILLNPPKFYMVDFYVLHFLNDAIMKPKRFLTSCCVYAQLFILNSTPIYHY